MSKGLEALEEIKTCKLIDHVKIKEGLFSNKLLSYERRYGKDVFSKQIPIIEKELKALEILIKWYQPYVIHDLCCYGATDEEIDLVREILK